MGHRSGLDCVHTSPWEKPVSFNPLTSLFLTHAAKTMSCLKDSQLQLCVSSYVTTALSFLDPFSFGELLQKSVCFLWDASIKRQRERKVLQPDGADLETDKLEELVLMTGLEQLRYSSYHSQPPVITASERTAALSVEVSTQNMGHWSSLASFFFLFKGSISEKLILLLN